MMLVEVLGIIDFKNGGVDDKHSSNSSACFDVMKKKLFDLQQLHRW